ncbi:potassium-transporting ATPase subunit KdpC [Megasphaera sueciensis]|uniref:potassium-transporting ATPase subunit KdpC n=1 Tax=Megasphaera sueciensis TaxID=349094 RepID=UPI003CFC550F
MWQPIIKSIKLIVICTIVTGLIYPFAMTGVAQLLFPTQANGSLLINTDGTIVGSELIGQNFQSDRYFHGRPSAAGDDGYDAMSSGGSNLGPTNEKLISQVLDNMDDVRKSNDMLDSAEVPSDLVLASASGLDPHITPDAAYVQARRVAETRHMNVQTVKNLIKEHIETKQLGFLGKDKVNVLVLNRALDTAAQS